MIWVLLIAFQIKHFLADYPMQMPYMLGKFKDKGWVKPLAHHCTVHAIMTFMIATLAVPNESYLWFCLGLALLDFSIHFIMDRIKASPHMLGQFKALTAKDFPQATQQMKKANTYFWWSLGLDQMVHHLTHYLVVYLIIGAANS